MKLRHVLRLCVLSVSLVIGLSAAPAVRADVLVPKPKPQPKPPKPQPPLPPEPAPIPDDAENASRPVVIATAASLGVTLLGVWVVRRQFRRQNPVRQLA